LPIGPGTFDIGASSVKIWLLRVGDGTNDPGNDPGKRADISGKSTYFAWMKNGWFCVPGSTCALKDFEVGSSDQGR
jgi:hypothetical protein